MIKNFKIKLKQIIRSILPRKTRSHRILTGPLKGFRIVTSWHDYPAAILGYTERSLLEWFENNILPGETWLDVGAHYGYTAIALSKCVGPTGSVYAFEPSIRTAGYLVQTRAKNDLQQLTVIPFGLGGMDDLEILTLPVDRGMLDSTVDRADWFETLLVTRLDWLWPTLGGVNNTIDGIKIDVQGMEIEVLQGMREVLLEHQPKLIIEIHKGVDRGKFFKQLEASGYSIVGTPIDIDLGATELEFSDDNSYIFNPIA